MKEFDINKIGKEMPYKAPNADFFDNFTEEVLAKVESKRRITLISRLAPMCGIAAAAAVILMVVFDVIPSRGIIDDGYMSSENIVESFDSYLTSLSDEEFDRLFAESACQDDFYLNLPYN